MFEMLTAVLTLAVQDGDAAAADAPVEAAASTADAAVAAADSVLIGGGTAFALFVAAIVFSFVIGAVIAKSMRVTEWGFRFGVCLAALSLGALPFGIRLLNGQSVGSGIRLGI
ncbi:MAG: hypothetical protein KDA89_16865, partial [Planctomycetaceae bacterium]|nr:hypothetical protein [Planctomycetaceae bacterium]